MDRLNNMGIHGPSWCVLCKRDVEPDDHLFLNGVHSRVLELASKYIDMDGA